MSTNGIPEGAADPQRIRQLLEQFLQAWEQIEGAGEVDIDTYVPSVGDPDRAWACSRLVAIDIQQRWRHRQAVLLEEYLLRYPELASPKIVLELLHEEYLIRKRYDPTVNLQSYRTRFPELYRELTRKDDQLGTIVANSQTLQAPTFHSSVNKPAADANSRHLRTVAVGGGNAGPPEGNYELIEPLGRGQFGEVWRAEAPGGVEVAVKIISFPVGHRMTQLELQSLEVMRKLRHSFLLQVQAYWIDAEKLFVVMELGDETLLDLAKRYADLGERIPGHKLIKYFDEACEAVDFLHSQHVLHRDIKPANILLVSGHVKVADFGISRVLSDDQTVTATTMGTPLYMAPEVWQGKMSPHSDQYSLAMTYAELRMGQAPYSGKSYYAVMNQHLQQAPDLHLLEEKERRVVLKALAKDPKDRYASCTDFANALRTALTPSPPSVRQPARFTAKVMMLSLILLAVVVGFIVWSRPRVARLSVTPTDLTVKAGKSVSVSVSVIGGQDTAAEVELQGLPQGITHMRRQDGPTTRFTFNVGPNVQPAEYAPSFLLKGDSVAVTEKFHLEVEPADAVQVDGFELSQNLRIVGARVFADRIYCNIAGQRIEFVLIPREDTDDPSTFYMMRTKVTNRLFAEFVAETSTKRSLHDDSREWHLGGRAGLDDRPAAQYPDNPVYGVHIEDAEAFAHWLGGRLPSAKQWDKAAGRGETEMAGPFSVPLAQLNSSLVAFDRLREGPAAVGASRADVSRHMCIDMAGNGCEYTRTECVTGVAGRDVSSVTELRDQYVVLRGASYRDPQPFLFEALDIDQTYGEVKRDVSFRVVIEDNRW